MGKKTRYTVLGAGNGGKAMAAHLALMGFSVTLYNRTPEHVAAIKVRGGIDLSSYEDGPHGFGELALVSSDLGEALEEAHVVMVVVPATAHAIDFGHVFNGGDEHVNVVSKEGGHHFSALVCGPQGSTVVKVQSYQTTLRFGCDGLLESFQQIVAFVAAVGAQAKGDARGMKELGVFQSGFPINVALAQLAGGGVHTLVPAGTPSGCPANLIKKPTNRFGPVGPNDVVGVHFLFAGNISNHPAVWIVRHAGDVAGRDP